MTREMTIEEAIAIIIREIDEDPFMMTEHRERLHDAFNIAVETMWKYQKIIKILNSASYIEDDKEYSYTYDEDARVKHIREVVEDTKKVETRFNNKKEEFNNAKI